MNNYQSFCVLGMHRSGTSLATRLINLLGVSLGPEKRLVKPRAANPKGFWEHQAIVKINNRILVSSGGNWQRPPEFIKGWQDAEDLEGLRKQARDLIKDDFEHAQRWGWKDPRACLTLPFWQQLVPSMRYILCFRNPVDVARSLRRRDGFSLEKGFYLWLSYMKSALEHTLGHPRVFVFYEDLLENWRSELRRLSQFIGDTERAGRSEVHAELEGFIDQKMRHHNTPIATEPKQNDSEIQRLILGITRHLFENHKNEEFVSQNLLHETFQEALDILTPIVKQEPQRPADDWAKKLQLATDEITGIIPSDEAFILAGEYQWASGEMVLHHPHIPFLEKAGQYWGPPADDAMAIQELVRVRETGARYFVFRWPSFWWLEHYSEFHALLRSEFPCVKENDRLIVFDLRPQDAPRPSVSLSSSSNKV